MDDVVTIRNEHSDDCGPIPHWAKDRPDDGYFAYFENEEGEQWFLLATSDVVRVAGGDAGWDQTHELRNPDWEKMRDECFMMWPLLMLGELERNWVELCLRTAAHRFH